MKNVSVLVMAGLLAGCGSASAPPTLDETLAGAASHFNRGGLSLINEELGATSMSARVENEDTLVMLVEGINTGRMTFDPQAMTRLMRDNICEDSWNRRVFESGGRLRIDFVSNFGHELPSIYFARCD